MYINFTYNPSVYCFTGEFFILQAASFIVILDNSSDLLIFIGGGSEKWLI